MVQYNPFVISQEAEMPTKVLPDAEAFASFTRALERQGFRKLSSTEFKKDFTRLELIAPSHREGREVGFSFKPAGDDEDILEVRVWTTFLDQEGRARDKDAGWVLIKEGDTPRYFSRPFSRTKNFLHRLLWAASIARWRVQNRPPCPTCGAKMRIAYGSGLKSRFWRCVRPLFHEKPVFLSWDYRLPQEALDFLNPIRKARARYNKKLRAVGKEPGTALQRRKGWKVTGPGNIEPKQ